MSRWIRASTSCSSRRSPPPRTIPAAEDLYPIGSVATVLQMLKLPDGTVKVLVEGAHRSSVIRVIDEGEYLSAAGGGAPGRPRRGA